MTEKRFDQKPIDEQIDELKAQIRELLRKLDTAVDKEAEILRPKLKAAQEKLLELKQAGAEAWGDLKPGLEKAWDELQKSLNQAATRFQTRPKGDR